MKYLIPISIILFLSLTVHSQNSELEKAYLNSSGRNISCTALDYAAEEIANQRKSLTRHPEYEYGSNSISVFDFMESYENKVKEDNKKEIWLTIKYEAGRTAKDYLLDKAEDVADYLPNPFEEAIDVGLSIAGNAADAILDHSKEEAEKEIWIERGNALSHGIEILAMDGKLSGNTNKEIAEKLKGLTYQNISPEDQAFANRGINRWMLDYVTENEGNIQEIRDKYNGIKVSQEELEIKQKEFSQKVNKDFKDFKDQTAKNFKEVYGSVEQLTRNQEEMNSEMNNIRDNVLENSKRIKENSRKIQENRDLGINNKALIKANRKFIEENRKLIVANKGQIDILNGYMYGTLDVDKQINAIKNGDLGTNLWSENDRTQALKALNKKKTFATINEVGRTCMEVLSKGYQIGDNLGLFDGKDGKRVAKAIDYAMKGLNVGMGLAKGFSGNPMGFMDAALGISSFFAKPKPSPEMQMLQKIAGKLEEMDTKLDSLCRGQLEIKAQLFYVSERLDTLLSRVFMLQQDIYELRIDMYKSFNVVYEQLDVIKKKIDKIDLKTNEILLENYQLCPQIFDGYDFTNISYRDILRIADSSGDTKYCLKGISTHVSQTGDEITTKVLMSTYTDPKIKKQIDFEIDSIFEPTFEIYNQLNVNKPQRSVPLLQPSFDFAGYYNLYSDTKKINLNANTSYVYPKYLNSNAVLKIAEFYLLALPLYEFENPSNGSFYTLEEWLSKDPYVRQGRYKMLVKRLKKLLQIVNYSIVQQNLISGGSINKSVYFNLFENRTGNPELVKKMKELVNNSSYLQHNLMNMVVKNQIKGVDAVNSYKKLYEENLGQKVTLSELLSDDFYNDVSVYLPEYDLSIISDFTYPQELYELVEMLCELEFEQQNELKFG